MLKYVPWIFRNSDGCAYLLRICLIYGTKCGCIAESNTSAGCQPPTRCLLSYEQTSASRNTFHN